MHVATYYINNIPVCIRSLPSGDIAIWHPYNHELASIIYQICIGKGYWKAKYKNWLIFSCFNESVVDAVKARSIQHG